MRLDSERTKLENTHYKLIRYEIKRPAEYIKKKLVESRVHFDATSVIELEEKTEDRRRAYSQENIRNDDTMNDGQSNVSQIGG